jgi:hypothetical protein
MVIVVSIACLPAAYGFTGGVAATHHLDYEDGDYPQADGFVVEPQDHSPGASGVTVNWKTAGEQVMKDAGLKWGFEYTEYIEFEIGAFSFTNCDLSDAGPTEIQRDGAHSDHGGAPTVGTIQYIKDFELGDKYLWSIYYDGSELSSPREQYNGGPGDGKGKGRKDGDRNVDWYSDDSWSTVFNDCVDNPDQKGWYQWTWYMNGTNAEGYEEGQEISSENSGQGEFVEFTARSQWIYICDCENEQEARDKLGDSPSEDGGSSSTPAPTDEPQTATPTPDDTDDSTATPTDTESEDQVTETVGETSTEAEQTDEQDGQQTDDGAGGQQVNNDEGSPTAGDGPGLGGLVAILALLGSALLVNKRS